MSTHFEPGERDRLGRAGVERRELLLASLRPVVARRGRRRRAGVVVSVCGLAVMAGVVMSLVMRSAVARHPEQALALASTSTEPVVVAPVNVEAASEPAIELVQTSAGLADRVGTRTIPSDAASDDDLIAALRATGQDPGLVRIDGRVVIAGGFTRK